MTRRIWMAAVIVLASAASACSDDDDGQVDVPEEGTGSAYTQAIIESSSHDEIILSDGGDMVVAVNCSPEGGGLPVVTAVAEGLADGVYTGVLDPSTGVDVMLEVAGAGEAVATARMALDEETYVVTFSSIDDGEFDLRGC